MKKSESSKMRRGLKRLGCALGCTALIMAAVWPGSEYHATATEANAPKAQIELAQIETDTLELSLEVNASAVNDKFQSIGTVLKVNSEYLTPIMWQEPTVTFPGHVVGDLRVNLTGATSWRNAAILPTKGSDYFSGKTAYAYQRAGDKWIYIYLSTEAAKPYEYAYEFDDATGGNAPIKTVTVRFQYNAAKAADKDAFNALLTPTGGVALSDVLTFAESANSPQVGGRNLFCVTEKTAYSYPQQTGEELLEPQDADVGYFLLNEDGQTVNTGGGGGPVAADTSKIRTIIFYDWDGTTELGQIAVQTGDPLSPDRYQELLRPYIDPAAGTISGFTYTPDAGNEGYIYNPDAATKPMITDKGGYTFVGWVPLAAEMSHYAAGEEIPEATDPQSEGLIKWEKADPDNDPDTLFTSITQNLKVKACYQGNSLCMDYGMYTIELVRVSRVEATENARVEVNVFRRFNGDEGKFSARLYRPVLAVSTVANEAQFYFDIDLENKDATSMSYIVPTTVSDFSMEIFDMYGAAWRENGAPSGLNMVVYSAGILQDGGGFGDIGIADYLTEQSKETYNAGQANIGTSAFNGAAYQTYFGMTVGFSDLANKNKQIVDAWKLANGATGAPMEESASKLTYGQIKAVLDGTEVAFIKDISFTDTDPETNELGGQISWSESGTLNGANVTEYKLFWSYEGGYPVAEEDGGLIGTAPAGSGGFTIPDDTYYDANFLCIMIYPYSSAGDEYPVCGIIPVVNLGAE